MSTSPIARGERPSAPSGIRGIFPSASAGVATAATPSAVATGALLAGVSVVVPVYNGAATVALLLERLEAVFRREGVAFEVLLVNDGSKDESWRTIEERARALPYVRGINMMRNFGQHNATLCGIREARFDTIVTMDDDLQHPPDEIPRLLRQLHEGFDVVYGTPVKQKHGLLRDMASSVTKMVLQRVMGAATARNVSAFRAFRTVLRRAYEGYGSPFVCIDVLLTWGTTAFSHVDVRHEERHAGTSNYTLGRLLLHAANMVTGFSVLPLQVASLMGFLCTAFGGLLFVFVFARYLVSGGAPPGFPMLASMVAIFSGAQLFALGVIGEYLARVHFRLLDRPSYAVRSTAEHEGAQT